MTQPKPFTLSIDKISFTTNDTDLSFVQVTHRKLHQLAQNRPDQLRLRTGRRHFIQAQYKIEGGSLLQCGPRHSGISHYRFEFNPNALGDAGVDQAVAFIDEITDARYASLLSNGTITRIDVALDLHDLTLEDVIIRSKGQRKFGAFTGQGKIETTYLGSAKANRTVAYVRDLDDGGTALRLERRLKPMCLGSDLGSLPNAFKRVDMIRASALRPILGEYAHAVLDSIRLRGLSRVLKTLPRDHRQAIEALLSSPQENLMPSLDEIWKQWPTLLGDQLRVDIADTYGLILPQFDTPGRPASSVAASQWRETAQ